MGGQKFCLPKHSTPYSYVSPKRRMSVKVIKLLPCTKVFTIPYAVNNRFSILTKVCKLPCSTRPDHDDSWQAIWGAEVM